MFLTIFKKELKYWFNKPVFYIYAAIFLVLSFLISATTAGVFDGFTGTTGSSKIVNSPINVTGLFNGFTTLIFFLFPALIFAEYDFEGKWIAPSFTPEKIIEIKKKGDIYEAYEVKQASSSVNIYNSKRLFKFDIKNMRTFSRSDEGDVLLARNDLWIDDGGGHIHRDSRSKSKRMLAVVRRGN